MLHPEHERDPLPQPDGTAQLNIYPFREQQRYVSFYPYYVPSTYTDYYPKKFGRYYEPVRRPMLPVASVSTVEPRRNPFYRWLLVLAIVLFAIWFLRK